MTDTPDRLAVRLQTEGQKTLEFFLNMTPEQWSCQVYTEGSCWAVRQVLAHFVATEAAMARLVENIASGGSGSREDFNIDYYNERKVASLQNHSIEDLLRRYAELRQASVELVARLQPEDLARRGRHPFLGITDLKEIIKLIYRHNQIHQREVRKAIAPRDGEEEKISG